VKRKIIVISLGLLVLGFGKADFSLAAVRCEPQYGGEVCVRLGDLRIDKVVWDPQREKFVDNLDLTDHRFSLQDEVAFQLRIKNIGDATFEKVVVKDELPSFLELVSGDLEFEIFDLAPGETETRDIKTKVKSESQLPTEKSVICDVNLAVAKADSEEAKDTAKICLSKKVAEVKVLPITGPERTPLVLSLSLIGGLTGLALVVLNRL